MWTEAIWEVVSAASSEVKFIVSDDPVTFYNYAAQPSTVADEPALEMVGTQTVFPLSLDLCLILTHRQLALDPTGVDPKQSRINARYYDTAIFSSDGVIFDRRLSEPEVLRINCLLKSQATRYVAAARKEWLYPERVAEIKCEWPDFQSVLLPPRAQIHFTQSIFFGYKDGSMKGYDPYGRDITDEEEIAGMKKSMLAVKRLFRKDKFSEYLTDLLDKHPQPTLQEQNNILLKGIADIFGISEIDVLSDLRETIDADQVKKLYMLIEDLWPVGTETLRHFHKGNGSSILYAGEMDAFSLCENLLPLTAYCDHIYLTSPFPHPCCLNEEYNPLNIPQKYLATTYESLICILLMQPWIETEQVRIIPNPLAIDFAFRALTIDSIKRRKGQLEFNPNDLSVLSHIINEHERTLCMAPNESLRHMIRKMMPRMPDSGVDALVEHIRDIKKHDITVWTVPVNKCGPQMRVTRIGENMETTLYLSQMTNTVPYTNLPFKVDELEGVNACSERHCNYEVPFLRCSDGYRMKALKEQGVYTTVCALLKAIHADGGCDKSLLSAFGEAASAIQSDPQIVKYIQEQNTDRKDLWKTRVLTMHFGNYNLPSVTQHLRRLGLDNCPDGLSTYFSVLS